MSAENAQRSLPWYPWYARDFHSATRGWSVTARGGLREALDIQWELGSVPADPDEFRSVMNATNKEWREIWPKIEAKFPLCEDGKRRNARLEQERRRAVRVSTVRSELGLLGARKRWSKDSNGHSNSQGRGNGNSHSDGMPSTSTSTSTITNLNPSEHVTARKRARPANPTGPRARTSSSKTVDPLRIGRELIRTVPGIRDAELAIQGYSTDEIKILREESTRCGHPTGARAG